MLYSGKNEYEKLIVYIGLHGGGGCAQFVLLSGWLQLQMQMRVPRRR